MKGSCWANVQKMLQRIKKDNLSFIVMLFWPTRNHDFSTSGEVWPLIKVEVWVEYNKLYFCTKLWFNSYVTQIVASSLNAVLLWALRNLSKSLIGNSELTCCDIFIFHIHMVTQLDSLIWVEVHFVKETKNKSQQIWSSFGCSNWISKIEPRQFGPCLDWMSEPWISVLGTPLWSFVSS